MSYPTLSWCSSIIHSHSPLDSTSSSDRFHPPSSTSLASEKSRESPMSGQSRYHCLSIYLSLLSKTRKWWPMGRVSTLLFSPFTPTLSLHSDECSPVICGDSRQSQQPCLSIYHSLTDESIAYVQNQYSPLVSTLQSFAEIECGWNNLVCGRGE